LPPRKLARSHEYGKMSFRHTCRDQFALAGATEAGRYETRGKWRIRSVTFLVTLRGSLTDLKWQIPRPWPAN
jgi:hypothetical protein